MAKPGNPQAIGRRFREFADTPFLNGKLLFRFDGLIVGEKLPGHRQECRALWSRMDIYKSVLAVLLGFLDPFQSCPLRRSAKTGATGVEAAQEKQQRHR